MVGMTSREFLMKALPVLSVVAGTLAFYSPALAHCRVTDLKLEQAISRKNELRQSANAQVVRDLRTLREAAIILDANQHPAECQRLHEPHLRLLQAQQERRIPRQPAQRERLDELGPILPLAA